MTNVLKLFHGLGNWLLGEDDKHPPPLPEGLPNDLQQALDRHVRMLVEFQNAEYAALYLDRLGRFYRRHGISAALLREIADLLAARMSFNDPIRVAQILLGQALLTDLETAGIELPNNLYRAEFEELVAMLPRDQAETLAGALIALKVLRGRTRIHPDTATGRAKLKCLLLFRRIRPQSLRFARENSSTERWLHMIDRALAKEPSALDEVVRSIRVVSGCGASYRLALLNWNLIVNNLAKPVFDGDLALPHLPDALARARGAATADATGEALRRTIADIRAAAASGGAGASPAFRS